MKININNREVVLNSGELKHSKKICVDFLKNVEEVSEKHTQKSFYFTTLVVMHVLTQQLLDEMNPDTLSDYMKMINELRQNNPNL